MCLLVIYLKQEATTLIQLINLRVSHHRFHPTNSRCLMCFPAVFHVLLLLETVQEDGDNLFVCVCVCYLPSAETNHQVSYKGVLCFSGAVAHHHAPAVLLGQLAPKTSIKL